MEDEKWKEINLRGRIYEVSNYGVIRYFRKDENEYYYHKIVRDSDGYLHFTYSINGRVKTQRVHRLVAQLFVDNPFNLKEVDHIDDNKENNHYRNLIWVSRRVNNSKPRHRNNRMQYIECLKMVKMYKKGYSINYIASECGFTRVAVSNFLNGRTYKKYNLIDNELIEYRKTRPHRALIERSGVS